MKTKECKFCGKKFEDNKLETKLYCSKTCKSKYWQGVEGKDVCNLRAKRYREGIKNNPELYKKELEKRREFEKLPKYKYRSIKSEAKQRSYTFDLTLDEYKDNFFNKPCYYCGDKTQNGIDRVDNSIGYELYNCVPCCETCNGMKSNTSTSDFFSQIEKIYNKHCRG